MFTYQPGNQGLGVGRAPNTVCIGPVTIKPNRVVFKPRKSCPQYTPTLRRKSPNPNQPPVPNFHVEPSQMRIGNQCISGIFTNGIISATTCVANRASQLWFEFFGQIRNVESGMCLDAPDASGGDSSRQSEVRLRKCGEYPPPTTSLWILQSDGSIVNGENWNCIRTKVMSNGKTGVFLG
jgi:hypothetical protein